MRISKIKSLLQNSPAKLAPVARLANPLLMLAIAAAIGRRRQARTRGQLPLVAKSPPAEKLHHQQPARLPTDSFQLQQ